MRRTRRADWRWPYHRQRRGWLRDHGFIRENTVTVGWRLAVLCLVLPERGLPHIVRSFRRWTVLPGDVIENWPRDLLLVVTAVRNDLIIGIAVSGDLAAWRGGIAGDPAPYRNLVRVDRRDFTWERAGVYFDTEEYDRAKQLAGVL